MEKIALKGIVEKIADTAKLNLKKDGELAPVILTDKFAYQLKFLTHEQKQMELLAFIHEAKDREVEWVLMISESWFVKTKDKDEAKNIVAGKMKLSAHSDRQECINLMAMSKDAEVHLMIPFMKLESGIEFRDENWFDSNMGGYFADEFRKIWR